MLANGVSFLTTTSLPSEGPSAKGQGPRAKGQRPELRDRAVRRPSALGAWPT